MTFICSFPFLQAKVYNMPVTKRLRTSELFVNFDMRDFKDVRRLLSLGNGKAKSGALAFYALDKNFAIVSLDNMFNYRKS